MWISVASGKGGTGKTTVAVSLALSNKNTVYVDADVEEPNGFLFIKPVIKEEFSYTELIPLIHQNKCTFCGKCADACVYKAIAILKPVKKAIFFPELCHSCGLCSFVCPVENAIEEVPKEKGKIRKGEKNGQLFIEGILNVGEASGTPLIRGMKKYIPHDDRDVIIDSSPGTSCPVVESVGDTDFVLLVTEPTPFGLNDLKLAIEMVRKMKLPFGILVNKHEEGNNLIRDYAREEKITILGEIPFSREIAEAYSKGIPVVNILPEGEKFFVNVMEKIRKGANTSG